MRIPLARVLLLVALLAFILGDISSVTASPDHTVVSEQEQDDSDVHVSQSAHDDDDNYEDYVDENTVDNDEMTKDFEEYMRETRAIDLPPAIGHVIFPNSESPAFPQLAAGVTTDSVVAFKNTGLEDRHTIFLVTAMLQPARQYNNVIQNFSVVRHARQVMRNDTVSLQYSFTPHPMLEPGEYNLLLRVFYNSDTGGTPQSVTAFNSTVLIREAPGADGRMLLTYITLVAILCGIVYAVANHYGVVKQIMSYVSSHKRAPPVKDVQQEQSQKKHTGAENDAEAGEYDADYISPEHLRFREMLLKGQQGNKKKNSKK